MKSMQTNIMLRLRNLKIEVYPKLPINENKIEAN